MIFYLGATNVMWLTRTVAPLCLSYRSLQRYRKLPRALGRWILDSGAFTEISSRGRWTVSPEEYADAVRRIHEEVGGMDWAAIQDWMCEPNIIKKTGLSVYDHQCRTVDSLCALRKLAPEIPWTPVLQGWRSEDYTRHRILYHLAGFPLERERVVGLGSVCRRTDSLEIWRVASENRDLKLHGFGVKLRAIDTSGRYLASSDSMAWSMDARYGDPLPGHSHRKCHHCLEYALKWRQKVIDRVDQLWWA